MYFNAVPFHVVGVATLSSRTSIISGKKFRLGDFSSPVLKTKENH